MGNIKSYIDECITTGNYSTTSGNLFSRIGNRVKVFKEAFNKGGLNPAIYSGIDKLIAERVITLSNRTTSSPEVVIPSVSTPATRQGKAMYLPYGREGTEEGYVTWAGNESYLCPWLTRYISSDSSESSSTHHNLSVSGSFNFVSQCKGVTFNTTHVLTDQNRQIAITSTQVLKLSKEARNATLSVITDKEAFHSDGAAGTPIKVIDLSSVLPTGNWCFGKILYEKDIISFGVYIFADDRSKDAFERPKYYTVNNDEAKGYTVEAQLVLLNLNSGKINKVSCGLLSSQTKLNTVVGYTDHILHQGKIFAIRSASKRTVTFSGFLLGERKETRGYIKTGKVSHTFDSFAFEIVQVELTPTGNTNITMVGEVQPPATEPEGKFGISGSKIAYTCAKLAASDLNPYTFYVQQYYELILQLPYDYDKGFKSTLYWETSTGKKLRTDTAYRDWFMEGNATSYVQRNAIITPLDSLRFGGINKIAGQLYIEVPVKYNTNGSYSGASSVCIYELVGEAQPTFSPLTKDWKRWSHAGDTNYYWWDVGMYNANALDLWVVWHMVSNELGTGTSKTANIVAELNLMMYSSKHPFAIAVAKAKEEGRTLPSYVKDAGAWGYGKDLKWSPSLEKPIGSFSFPYEKWYTYFGGNRGTDSYGISGYDSWSETFLVTYAGEKYAKEGQRTAETARPVLIICGIGPYAELWGAKGWGGQITQSPLVVEVWNYETAAGINARVFSHCNSETQPKVYMQADETVMGVIGNYWTGYDLTDPTIELQHGMYPLAGNGSHINENKEQITNTSLTFSAVAFKKDNLRQIYMAMFSRATAYNVTTRKYEINNYYLETRAYEVKNRKPASITPDDKKSDFNAAVVKTFWWSKTAPARITDPVPWFGPCQLDMHITL